MDTAVTNYGNSTQKYMTKSEKSQKKESLRGAVSRATELAFKVTSDKFFRDCDSEDRLTANKARKEVRELVENTRSAILKLNKGLETRVTTLTTRIEKNQNSLFGRILNIWFKIVLSTYKKLSSKLTESLNSLNDMTVLPHLKYHLSTTQECKTLLEKKGFSGIIELDKLTEHLAKSGFELDEPDDITSQSDIIEFNTQIKNYLESFPAYPLVCVKYDLESILDGSAIISPEILQDVLNICTASVPLDETQVTSLLEALQYDRFLPAEHFEHFKNYLVENKLCLEPEGTEISEVNKKVLAVMAQKCYSNEGVQTVTSDDVSDGSKFANLLVTHGILKTYENESLTDRVRALHIIQNSLHLTGPIADELANFLITQNLRIQHYGRTSSRQEESQLNSAILRFLEPLALKAQNKLRPRIGISDRTKAILENQRKALQTTMETYRQKFSLGALEDSFQLFKGNELREAFIAFTSKAVTTAQANLLFELSGINSLPENELKEFRQLLQAIQLHVGGDGELSRENHLLFNQLFLGFLVDKYPASQDQLATLDLTTATPLQLLETCIPKSAISKDLRASLESYYDLVVPGPGPSPDKAPTVLGSLKKRVSAIAETTARAVATVLAAPKLHKSHTQ
jgi:hypothetical protein